MTNATVSSWESPSLIPRSRKWALRVQSLRAYNRASVHLRRRDERDLSGGSCGEDLRVGEELLWRDRLEHDLHFLPERVEAVALDRVKHAGEHDPGRLGLIGHVDGVDRAVVCEQRSLAAARLLLEVDGEELTVVGG